MFTLKHEFGGYESETLVQPPKTVTMDLHTEEANIDELCEFFGDFLKACGYHFDGEIRLVNGDDMYVRLEDLQGLGTNESEPSDTEESGTEETQPLPVQTEFNFEGKGL
jgi:hypothetical protein